MWAWLRKLRGTAQHGRGSVTISEELARRHQILADLLRLWLRSDLSHPDLGYGTRPPADWINEELAARGETWRV
jgi:hypothetical protein